MSLEKNWNLRTTREGEREGRREMKWWTEREGGWLFVHRIQGVDMQRFLGLGEGVARPSTLGLRKNEGQPDNDALYSESTTQCTYVPEPCSRHSGRAESRTRHSSWSNHELWEPSKHPVFFLILRYHTTSSRVRFLRFSGAP